MKRLPLAVEPEAEADMLDAFEWYESQKLGLGHEFMDCVDDVFDRIAQNPRQFAISYREMRQALIRRFPYIVCFIIDPHRITVIAVVHSGRDPRVWQARA